MLSVYPCVTVLPAYCSTLFRFFIIAEDVGFEPTEPLSSHVFKTCAFDHSANLPILVVPLGLEPRMTVPKTVVLPLHHGTIKNNPLNSR